jgi:hypothetical protein
MLIFAPVSTVYIRFSEILPGDDVIRLHPVFQAQALHLVKVRR